MSLAGRDHVDVAEGVQQRGQIGEQRRVDAVVVGEQDAHDLGQDRVLSVSARTSEPSRFSRADLISFGVAAAASLGALALKAAGASGAVVFVAAAVSVMALAYVLGEATDQAGTASGPRLASLLNATFGNLPELIIVVLTVREGLIDVARASIIGSVIGNILLVLGASILLGGLRNGSMSFDQAQRRHERVDADARGGRARAAVALRRPPRHDAPRAGRALLRRRGHHGGAVRGLPAVLVHPAAHGARPSRGRRHAGGRAPR